MPRLRSLCDSKRGATAGGSRVTDVKLGRGTVADAQGDKEICTGVLGWAGLPITPRSLCAGIGFLTGSQIRLGLIHIDEGAPFV